MGAVQRASGRVAALVRACHPEPTATVTGVMTAFAVSAGRGRGAAWVGSAVLAGQLSVGWSNDYLDRDRDLRTGRRDKPIPAGAVAADLVRTGAVVALAASVPLSLASGRRAAVAHLSGVAAAWGYNLGLKRTVLSPLPYAVGFGGLPAFVVLGLPHHPVPPPWLVAAGALLGVGAHFANVLPDIDDDLATGVRGLPHRLGAPASTSLSAGLLLAASVLLALAPGGPTARAEYGGGTRDGGRSAWLAPAGVAAAGVLLVAGLATGHRPGSRAAFRVTLVVAALDVALLIARGATVA